MKLKLLSTLLICSAANYGFADEAGIWANGTVTYKHPNGNLVDRSCQLWVPAMGLGEVTLQCGTWSTSTTNFETLKENGKTTFSVVFENMNGAPEGAVAKYTGAYIRGNNRALYYGDVFSGMKNNNTNVTWNYVGGFVFSKDIE